MTLDDTPRLEAISERDIDMLLMEELESGSGFLEWFIGETTGWCSSGLDLQGVWHSISNEHGESDLTLVAGRPGGERIALLIENKLNAPPQPEQSARYQRRGELGKADGHWQEYATCLVAPKRYLGASVNAAGYFSTVSYEDMPSGCKVAYHREVALNSNGDFCLKRSSNSGAAIPRRLIP